jgi:hypothetical protein
MPSFLPPSAIASPGSNSSTNASLYSNSTYHWSGNSTNSSLSGNGTTNGTANGTVTGYNALPASLRHLLKPEIPYAVKTVLSVDVQAFENGCNLKWKAYLQDEANELKALHRSCDLFIRTKRLEYCSDSCAASVKSLRALMKKEVGASNCIIEDRKTTSMLDVFANAGCGAEVIKQVGVVYDSKGNPVSISGGEVVDSQGKPLTSSVKVFDKKGRPVTVATSGVFHDSKGNTITISGGEIFDSHGNQLPPSTKLFDSKGSAVAAAGSTTFFDSNGNEVTISGGQAFDQNGKTIASAASTKLFDWKGNPVTVSGSGVFYDSKGNPVAMSTTQWKGYLADDANELKAMMRTCDSFVRTRAREFCTKECEYRVKAFRALLQRQPAVAKIVAKDKKVSGLLEDFESNLCGSTNLPSYDSDLAYDASGQPITYSGNPDMKLGINFGHVNNHPAPDTIPRIIPDKTSAPAASSSTVNTTASMIHAKRFTQVHTGKKESIKLNGYMQDVVTGGPRSMYVEGHLLHGVAAIVNKTYGLIYNNTFYPNPNSPIDVCVPNPCAPGLRCVTGTCQVAPCFNYSCVNVTKLRLDAAEKAGVRVIPTSGSYDHLGRELTDFNHTLISSPLSEDQIAAIPLPPELTKQDAAACIGTLGPLQGVREGCALFLANNTETPCPRPCAVALRLFRYLVDMSSEVAKCLVLPEFAEAVNEFSNTACSPARLGLLFKPTIPIRDTLVGRNPAYKILHPAIPPIPVEYLGSIPIFDAGGKVVGYRPKPPPAPAAPSYQGSNFTEPGIVLGGLKQFLLPTEGFADGGNGLERFEPLKPYDPYEEKGYCKGNAGKVVVDDTGKPVYCKPRPPPIQVDERGRPIYPDVKPSGRIRYNPDFQIDDQGAPLYEAPPARGQLPFQAPFGRIAGAVSGTGQGVTPQIANAQLPPLNQQPRAVEKTTISRNGLEYVELSAPPNATNASSSAIPGLNVSVVAPASNGAQSSVQGASANASAPRLPDDGRDILLKVEELKLFARHFAHKLITLHQSGYTDKSKNIRLLVKYHGDINKVMAAQDPTRFPNVPLDPDSNDDDPTPVEPITKFVVEKVVNETDTAPAPIPAPIMNITVPVAQPTITPPPLRPRIVSSDEPLDILQVAFGGKAQM